MTSRLFRLAALLTAIAFQLACYSQYAITTEELEKLQSGNFSNEPVIVNSEIGPLVVEPTTPVQIDYDEGNGVITTSITPFNFAMTPGENGQLVAPDYDLLVSRSAIVEGRVAQFRKGRTIGLIVGSVLAAAGAFVAITALAGSEEQ